MHAKTLTTQINKNTQRLVAAVIFFAALTALTAQIKIQLVPVPITLQTLAVVLSGLVLGARGGAAAQLAYLSMIAIGLPVDANNIGQAAFFGPTAGYLFGFVIAAYVTGWLSERFATTNWWGHFVAALAGAITLYIVGASWLAAVIGWQNAWLFGVAPFILWDLGKAIVAASVAESAKYWINR
ncbi:biotin transporter BioY [Anaerolineales bacterium HSG6]|nr:biotin transporter BioY [Anaerolineales bacterium HSG6]MDM8531816.1 biotin transporter BioY [Anaerolineales bacterium HSG25]